jgi:hypothetical protein
VLKILGCFILMLGTIVNARDITIPFSLKDSVAQLSNDSMLYIVCPTKFPKEYKYGELQVDVHFYDGTVTMRDTTFRMLPDAKSGTIIIIYLNQLLNRYYSERDAHSTEPIDPNSMGWIRKVGMNWRIRK